MRLGLESRGTHQRSTGDQGTGQQRLAFIIYLSPQLNDSSEDLDLPGHGLAASSGDLSCDSRANSDYEDTDGEGAYTDREGGPQDVDDEPPPMALARSSEPVWVDDHQGLMGHGMTTAEWETQVGTGLQGGEYMIPPLTSGTTPSTRVSRGHCLPPLPSRRTADTPGTRGTRTACYGKCP